MSGHRVTMLGTGLIGLFYTRDAARAAEPRQRPRRLLSLGGSRPRVRAGGRRGEVVDRSRGSDRPCRDRHGDRRPAQSVARGGDRALRAPRQGRPLHETARAHGRGGEANSRHRRERRHLRRLSRGSRLHAEDAEGAGDGPRRVDRRRHVGALARDASRARTARGSGTRSRPAAGRSSTSAVTASRSSATSSARRTGRST